MLMMRSKSSVVGMSGDVCPGKSSPGWTLAKECNTHDVHHFSRLPPSSLPWGGGMC